jgi:hypothetical protein
MGWRLTTVALGIQSRWVICLCRYLRRFSDALLYPDITPEPVVEDWVGISQQAGNDERTERASVLELIQCIIRCCGLKAEFQEAKAVEVHGVLDVIESIQDGTVNVSTTHFTEIPSS